MESPAQHPSSSAAPQRPSCSSATDPTAPPSRPSNARQAKPPTSQSVPAAAKSTRKCGQKQSASLLHFLR
eukprot:3050128-Rhodomonas_salina.2